MTDEPRGPRVHRPRATATWTQNHRWGSSLGDSTELTVRRTDADRMTIRYGKDEVEIPAELVASLAAMVADAATWSDEPLATALARRTVTVPEPFVPFGPEGVEPREATASYLADAAARVRDQRYWGSNVTDAVAKLLEDTVLAMRGDT